MVAKLLHSALLLILSAALTACSGSAILFANALARINGGTIITDVPYNDESHLADIYLPEDRSAQNPVVIFFYGGCWGACLTYTKPDYSFVAEAFTSMGYITVIPDYRTYPDVLFEDIMRDASAVTRWVHNNIENYGGDADSIVLAGHSAGAHMAAMLTLDETRLDTDTRSAIKGFIGLAGPYDFLPFTEDYQPLLFAPESRFPASQPVNFVDGDEPPLLLLYGNDDTRVFPVNIESLTRITEQKGGDVTSIRYDGIDHAGIIAALSIPFRDSDPVMANIKEFMDRVAPVP